MKYGQSISAWLIAALIAAGAQGAEQNLGAAHQQTAAAIPTFAAPGQYHQVNHQNGCAPGAPGYNYGTYGNGFGYSQGVVGGAPAVPAMNYGYQPNVSYGTPAVTTYPAPAVTNVPAAPAPAQAAPPAVPSYAAPSAAVGANVAPAGAEVFNNTTVMGAPTMGAPAMGAPAMGAPAATEVVGGPMVGQAVGPVAGSFVDGGFGGAYFGQDANWCAPVVAPPARTCPVFFGGVYGLIMDRVDSDDVRFLYDPDLPSRTYLGSRDASMNTAGGFEARIGKTFCNCSWAIEGVYWGIFPNDQFASAHINDVPAAAVYTAHDYRDAWVDYSGGRDTIDTLFNDRSIQFAELRRSFEYHNIEINFLSGPLGPMPQPAPCGAVGPVGAAGGLAGGAFGGGYAGTCGSACGGAAACGSACGPSCGGGCGNGGLFRPCANNCGVGPRWQAGWLFGVRYFRIDESFLLGVDNGDGVIDYSYTGGDNEFFQEVETENHLVGVQLGLNLDYFITRCLHFDFGSKFGFYGNHINNYQRIFNEFGPGYVTPATQRDLAIRSQEDDIAFLGEIRAGLGYKIGCHWRLTGGYRAVAASNVALPLNQIANGRTLVDTAYTGAINNDASLILHGAYAGAEFAW